MFKLKGKKKNHNFIHKKVGYLEMNKDLKASSKLADQIFKFCNIMEQLDMLLYILFHVRHLQ